MSRPKKTKVTDLKQLNGKEQEAPKATETTTPKPIIEATGKIEEPLPDPNRALASQPVYKPTTLEQVWGGSNFLARYGTLKPEEYAEKLRGMNRADLEKEARRVGTTIPQQTERLIDNLKNKFNGFTASLRIPVDQKEKTKLTQAARDVLKEGR